MDKLIFYLEELQKKFNDKLLKVFFEALDNTPQYIVEEAFDNPEFIELFMNQDKRFYDELALRFVDEMNDEFAAISFFYNWESIIHTLRNSPEKFQYFFNKAQKLASGKPAWNIINGIIYFENFQPKKALEFFSKGDSPLYEYFAGISYFENENYENAIRKYLLFLEHFNNVLDLMKLKLKDFNKEEDDILRSVFWGVYFELGYAYSRLGYYKKANQYIEKAFNIYNYDELFFIDEERFQVIMHNYYFNNLKLNNIDKAKEILTILRDKFPENKYYQKHLDEDIELQRLIKIRKPYDIESFITSTQIAKEKNLENLIVDQIAYGYKVFNKELEIYQDDEIYGQQTFLENINGYLDLLLIDKKKNTLYVVEIKRNKSSVSVIEQIEKYMDAIKEKYPSYNVKGIILLHSANEKIKNIIKNKPEIEIFTYSLTFNQVQ